MDLACEEEQQINLKILTPMETETKSFDATCRACMSKQINLHSIFEYVGESLRIREMLATAVPQLIIQEDDELPDTLCAVCLNKLNITYRFQQMCVTSEKQMRKSLIADLRSTKPEQQGADPLYENDFLEVPYAFKLQEEVSVLKPTGKLDLLRLLENGVVEEEPSSCISQNNYVSFFNDGAESVEINGNEETEEDDLVHGVSDDETGEEHIVYEPLEDEPEPEPEPEPELKASPARVKSKKKTEEEVAEIESPQERNMRKGHHPCPHCGKVFDRQHRLTRHINVHSLSRAYECDICKYRFASKNYLLAHTLKHEEGSLNKPAPPGGYKCSKCPRRFAKCQSLAAHNRKHRSKSPPKQFPCDHCSKHFKKAVYLKQHLRVTHSIVDEDDNTPGKHECVYCKKVFRFKGLLNDHMRSHTGERPFLCPQCGKAFRNGSNMRQHLMRHSDEKRYQCPECPSKFACRSDQTKHMSVHRSVKPHVCDSCGRSFSRSYTLAKHKQIHIGERPYKCEECNMSFIFLDHMRRHMRTHTGERPYKCKYCDRAYSESGDLNRHMRFHVGDKTYICTKCSTAFKYQTELREHMNEHYKEEQHLTTLTEIDETVELLMVPMTPTDVDSIIVSSPALDS